MRLSSSDKQTQADAATPMLFQKIRQPQTNYRAGAQRFSERRRHVPIGFMEPEVIVSNLVYALPGATAIPTPPRPLQHHAQRMDARAVAGRLKV